MPYIGKQLVRGQNRELDDISGSFNGSNTVFNLTVSGDSITPGSALQLFISVGGVLQNPNTDFTVAGNQITFTTAPGIGLSFFGILQGDAVDFNTPADGSVTTAKLGNNLTINVADGTEGTPSIQFNGSGTDTGFYSPTTDEIGASVAGGEALRIDSSGRLLVGTSNSFGFDNELQVKGDAAAIYRDDASTPTASANLNLHRSRGSGLVSNDDALGAINFFGDDGTDIRSFGAKISAEVDGTAGANDMPGRLVFSTTADGASSPTEHVRIDNEGSFFVGNGTKGTIGTIAGASNLGIFSVDVSNSSGASLRTSRDTGSANSVASFWGNSGLATIRGDGDLENTNNRYTGISDIKFKQNIEDASSQWEDVKAIKVRKYELIAHPERKHIGVVAQELEQVCPGLVIERQDEDTKEAYKSVAYSVLYMKAVKALQEAMERIESLEASNADLLARVSALESA